MLGRKVWGQLPDPLAHAGSSDVGQGHHPRARETSTPSLIQWQSHESQWDSLDMCPLSSWRCAVRHCPVSSVPWAVPVPSLGTLALKHSLWSSLARWDGRGHALLAMGLPSTPAMHTPQLHSWGLWGVAHTDMTDSSSTEPLCRWRTQICFPSLTVS